MKRTIAITGASGFIGKRLVSDLRREGDFRIRVFSRDKERDLREDIFGQGVEIVEGDVCAPDSLRDLLVPGCVVVNLVYLWKAGPEVNLAYTQALLDACKDAKVARLIHCSTADVVGRVPDNTVDESTFCCPINEYGMTKLKIEQAIINSAKNYLDAVILSPTSVLGIGGEPLKKLAENLTNGSRWKNYLKSCLFGRRRMNLVPVANVTAAIIFLVRHAGGFHGERFIVSDDDDANNNFIDVERALMYTLGIKDYSFPRLPIPLFVINWLLIFLGRNNVNPRRNFDPRKLRNMGFRNPVSLSAGLQEYGTWHRSFYHGEDGPHIS